MPGVTAFTIFELLRENQLGVKSNHIVSTVKQLAANDILLSIAIC